MKSSDGFTVVELLVGLVFLGIVSGISFDRYSTIQMVHRDQDRKVAINSMHYNLQEVVKPGAGGYPRVLTAAQLTAMNAALLTDPNGLKLGEASSDYRYEPTGCNGGDICSGYTLRANLELEQDFVKTPPTS